MKKRNQNILGKALLGSLITMLLCCAMLLGTTFAWFTDNASAKVNPIQTGTLSLSLQYAVKTDSQGQLVWDDVPPENQGRVALFDAAEGSLFEPGFTGVTYLRVVNTGNLDLKYRYEITVEENQVGRRGDTNIDLTNYLQLKSLHTDSSTVVTNEAFWDNVSFMNSTTNTSETGWTGVAFDSGEENAPIVRAGETGSPIAVVVQMPVSVGNAANSDGSVLPSISLSFHLTAIQAASDWNSLGSNSGKAETSNTTGLYGEPPAENPQGQ